MYGWVIYNLPTLNYIYKINVIIGVYDSLTYTNSVPLFSHMLEEYISCYLIIVQVFFLVVLSVLLMSLFVSNSFIDSPHCRTMLSR